MEFRPHNLSLASLSEMRPVVVGIWLALLTGLLYLQVAQFEFLNWDDTVYVTHNQYVTAGLSFEGFLWAFNGFHASNWHPLTWLSLMLDAELFGLSAGGFHLTNVALHGLNTVLLFACLLAATHQKWPSALVALLFAIHPSHVESVAWVSERKDLLSTTFFLLMLMAYVGIAEQKKKYAAVFLLLCCGLMSKGMLVTAPFLLVLFDVWPLKRINVGAPGNWFKDSGLSASLVQKIPLFVLVFAFSIVLVLAQGTAIKEELSFIARLENALVSYVRYLLTLFQPSKLTAFYPHLGGWSMVSVALATMLLLMISGCSLLWLRSRPYLFVGWWLFIIGLGPVIGLIQIGSQAMADRYLYIPSIGIFIGVTWLFFEVTGSLSRTWRLLPVAVLACVFSVQTWVYQGAWKNSVSLWHNAVIMNDDRYIPFMLSNEPVMETSGVLQGLIIPYTNLAIALADEGLTQESRMYFDIATSIAPDDVEHRIRYGRTLFLMGELIEAESVLEAASALDSEDPELAALLSAVEQLKTQQVITQ